MDGRRWTRNAGAILMLAGAIWVGQGLGIITFVRSFMVGDPAWVAIGGLFVFVGAILVSGRLPWRGL